jgi:hypothetical protein
MAQLQLVALLHEQKDLVTNKVAYGLIIQDYTSGGEIWIECDSKKHSQVMQKSYNDLISRGAEIQWSRVA